jgi:hypothetical protein
MTVAESALIRFVSVTLPPLSCFLDGTISSHDLVRWLSHVCDVITEPSADAADPTVTTVHLSGRLSPDSTSALTAAGASNDIKPAHSATIHPVFILVVSMTIPP